MKDYSYYVVKTNYSYLTKLSLLLWLQYCTDSDRSNCIYYMLYIYICMLGSLHDMGHSGSNIVNCIMFFLYSVCVFFVQCTCKVGIKSHWSVLQMRQNLQILP